LVSGVLLSWVRVAGFLGRLSGGLSGGLLSGGLFSDTLCSLVLGGRIVIALIVLCPPARLGS